MRQAHSRPVAVAGFTVVAALFASSGRALPKCDPALKVIKVHYSQRQQQSDRYGYVPFDVPPGTTRVDIEFRYDRAGGANVIDLGLLEPGPLDLGTKAFRGWSGGERSAVFVSATDATPGYWPGPIPPGQWHVGLGLYKVGGFRSGCGGHGSHLLVRCGFKRANFFALPPEGANQDGAGVVFGWPACAHSP